MLCYDTASLSKQSEPSGCLMHINSVMMMGAGDHCCPEGADDEGSDEKWSHGSLRSARPCGRASTLIADGALSWTHCALSDLLSHPGSCLILS